MTGGRVGVRPARLRDIFHELYSLYVSVYSDVRLSTRTTCYRSHTTICRMRYLQDSKDASGVEIPFCCTLSSPYLHSILPPINSCCRLPSRFSLPLSTGRCIVPDNQQPTLQLAVTRVSCCSSGNHLIICILYAIVHIIVSAILQKLVLLFWRKIQRR